MNIKIKTARLSIFSNVFLITIKLIAGFVGGSVSILSEAIHSMMDLIAAVIAYFSVKVSSQPPDKEHPYDHGKFENISGVVEGMLILVAAAWIIYEAVLKLIHPAEIAYLYLGMIVMLFSAAVNIYVSKRLYKVAKETDSIALEADALHLKTDVYTSLGVAGGIFLIWVTGIHILDPIIAIIVALFITFEAFKLIKNAYLPLLDTSLPADDLKQIQDIISNHTTPQITYHRFRTRKSGSHKYVDFHLEVPQEMSVKEAHALCDRIEIDLRNNIERLDINIHIEPL
ncbi:MAG: cation diffusion facilitator family transporter [Bacteroidales bacterium]|nr:cation diffusion facilitator family transporter [Bacteroidales bacterium]MCF8404522.1 cation diffusion facilitator family transporter [Bacteroidales bacterium]